MKSTAVKKRVQRTGSGDDPIILLENVSKSYTAGVPALNGINLHINKGEFVFVVGDSGSGKSTLIKLLLRELVPTSGRIFVNGTDVVRLKRRKIPKFRRSLGVVFQDFRLLPDRNVYDNIAFAMKVVEAPSRIIRGRVLAMLSMVGLLDKYKSFPNELSGGEQQRVAIAIALANNPKLLLADEPTGAVDRKTADDILEMFRKLNEKLGLTIVIVTHDKELAKKVNRVVSIRDGKTSSERIMKNDYRERMEHLDIDWQEEETQEEFAVLDRAGRVQIPSELLEQMGMDGNKVKLEFIGGKIVIEKPKD